VRATMAISTRGTLMSVARPVAVSGACRPVLLSVTEARYMLPRAALAVEQTGASPDCPPLKVMRVR